MIAGFDATERVAYLTQLYDWYGDDFARVTGSTLDYAAQHDPLLGQMLQSGEVPTVVWLDYDWRLNDVGNAGN